MRFIGENMVLRTVMIIPDFDNMNIIDQIREKYDPLSALVPPHITLVFPFASEISDTTLRSNLERELVGIQSFPLCLQGISKHEDKFGNYLFLDVKAGKEQIQKIHKLLYANELHEFDLGYDYVPHMTVGKLDSSEKLTDAYAEIQEMKDMFFAVAGSVYVERIGENEKSIIIMEKKLM